MVDKFTTQPTNKEVVNKINDIIDTMGSTQGANIDLSNLSATGEAKFVNTSGDTMTGDLSILNANPELCLENSQFDYTTRTAPSEWTGIGSFRVVDKNNNSVGWVQTAHNTNNEVITTFGARRSITGTEKTAQFSVYVTQAGATYSSFPTTWCCDGQWVIISGNEAILDDASLKNSSNTAVSKTASSIPNDGHVYEALFRGSITTGSTSGNYLKLQFRTNAFGNTVFVCSARTRSASTVTSMGTVIVPIRGGSSNVTIDRNSDYNGTADLTLMAYRRVGTNT